MGLPGQLEDLRSGQKRACHAPRVRAGPSKGHRPVPRCRLARYECQHLQRPQGVPRTDRRVRTEDVARGQGHPKAEAEGSANLRSEYDSGGGYQANAAGGGGKQHQTLHRHALIRCRQAQCSRSCQDFVFSELEGRRRQGPLPSFPQLHGRYTDQEPCEAAIRPDEDRPCQLRIAHRRTRCRGQAAATR